MEMTNRELLELAAKAAGIRIDVTFTDSYPPSNLPHGFVVVVNSTGGHSFWNPLRDDGDALRLAVKLDLSVVISQDHVEVNNFPMTGTGELRVGEPFLSEDTAPCVRRAIVRAAAELGKKLP
jgi:hypothetical protein